MVVRVCKLLLVCSSGNSSVKCGAALCHCNDCAPPHKIPSSAAIHFIHDPHLGLFELRAIPCVLDTMLLATKFDLFLYDEEAGAMVNQGMYQHQAVTRVLRQRIILEWSVFPAGHAHVQKSRVPARDNEQGIG